MCACANTARLPKASKQAQKKRVLQSSTRYGFLALNRLSSQLLSPLPPPVSLHAPSPPPAPKAELRQTPGHARCVVRSSTAGYSVPFHQLKGDVCGASLRENTAVCRSIVGVRVRVYVCVPQRQATPFLRDEKANAFHNVQRHETHATQKEKVRRSKRIEHNKANENGESLT